MTYYLCPLCKGLTMPSYRGHEYRYCTYCCRVIDIDDCRVVEQ